MSWADATLATYQDVLDRYANAYDLTGETVEADQQAKIEEYIGKAKDKIGRLLDVELRPRWAEIGVDSATDLKDLINNPDVFKHACVAWTLRLMFQDNSTQLEDFYDKMQDEFEKEFREEMNIAVALVEFDYDQSGDIEDDEKATGPIGNKFYRV